MPTYLSHIKNLRIVIAPATPVFEGGLKVADRPGKYAQFSDGRFETDDKDIAKKLESLSTFGIDFWRDGDREEEPKKPKEPELEKMTKKELLTLAHERNIQIDDKATKDEVIAVLKSATT